MSKVKIASKSEKKHPEVCVVGLDRADKQHTTPLKLPPKIAAKLSGSQKDRKLTPEMLKKDLDQAKERRMSLQADRTDRVRQHLARVQKVALMKKQNQPLTEETPTD
ncbi:hypothetical protein PHET_04457 [Paragonimus heterotremus]|uniref:Uncharacterized protein n=1 Tax=Paragonimus heterotremus TaxID=100268 RepID=A0A8J4X0A7_9TREM|nr:hypothetical protein PHET_04457 [Paragonimus heterotremus]